MKPMIAFSKKEYMEQIRTGKLTVLMILAFLFGIMNPAIAKLTPWLMDMVSENMENSGLTVVEVAVNDLVSWTQYYKNIPMFLVIFIIFFSGILANEYQHGTLINMLTKGLSRVTVLAAKFISIFVLWTLSYWMIYLITYAYNEYFWQNATTINLFLGGLCYYLFGLLMISMLMLGSILTKNNTGAILFTGGVYVVFLIAKLFTKLESYNPIKLCDGTSLITGSLIPADYIKSIIVMSIIFLLACILGVICFNKKQL